MTTPVSMREPPDGYTEQWNNELWNVGHLFYWSDVWNGWLDCQHRMTVKPGQTLQEAYEAATGDVMFSGYTLFFIN